MVIAYCLKPYFVPSLDIIDVVGRKTILSSSDLREKKFSFSFSTSELDLGVN